MTEHDVATITDRSQAARDRAVAALRMTLELLEEHPDRVKGLRFNSGMTEGGALMIDMQATVEP